MNKILYFATTALISVSALYAHAERPREIYAIGDFNEWQIPNDDELRGALPMSLSEGSEDYYWEDLNIPRGSEELMFYYHDSLTDSDIYLGSSLPPFTLYKFATSVSGTCTEGTSREEVTPFRLRDWRGTRIMGGFYYNSRNFSMAAFDGPTFSAPTEGDIFAIVAVDDSEPLIMALEEQQFNPYFWEVDFNDTNAGLTEMLADAKKVTIVFSTENQLSPSVENLWGKGNGEMAAEARIAVTEFLKGGEPFSFIFSNNECNPSFSIKANFTTGLAEVTPVDNAGESGLADIYYTNPQTPPQYYNLHGEKLQNPPQREPYILLQGNKSYKVMNFH